MGVDVRVGDLSPDDGFTTPKAPARWWSSAPPPPASTADYLSRKDLPAKEVGIGGHRGWAIRRDPVDTPLSVEGDVLVVIVVGTGPTDPLGIFVGVAPIADTERIEVLDGVVQDLEVG